MPEKVYVMTAADGLRSGAQGVLESHNAITVVVGADERLPRKYEGADIIAVFVAKDDRGHFPSKSLRKLASVKDAQDRGFVIPTELTAFLGATPARMIALRDTLCASDAGRRKLCVALENQHFLKADGTCWTGKKKPTRSRAEGIAAHREKRRSHRSWAYPLC